MLSRCFRHGSVGLAMGQGSSFANWIRRQIAAALVAVIVVATSVQTAVPDRAPTLAAVLELAKGPVPVGVEAQVPVPAWVVALDRASALTLELAQVPVLAEVEAQVPASAPA